MDCCAYLLSCSSDLGLAVIDEEQRFGVRQRNLLTEGHLSEHVLYMSATPIPRTLGLSLFGDIDVSQLTEKPPNSVQVQTTVVGTDKLEQVSSWSKLLQRTRVMLSECVV